MGKELADALRAVTAAEARAAVAEVCLYSLDIFPLWYISLSYGEWTSVLNVMTFNPCFSIKRMLRFHFANYGPSVCQARCSGLEAKIKSSEIKVYFLIVIISLRQHYKLSTSLPRAYFLRYACENFQMLDKCVFLVVCVWLKSVMVIISGPSFDELILIMVSQIWKGVKSNGTSHKELFWLTNSYVWKCFRRTWDLHAMFTFPDTMGSVFFFIKYLMPLDL